MSADGFTLRDAEPRDAGALAAMANALAREIESGPGLMTAEKVLADLVPGPPGLGCIVAERAGEAVAYALWTVTYETAYGERGLYLSDLYVAEGARGLGIGRALVAELSARAAEGDATFLWWVTGPRNEAANAVYDRLEALRYDLLGRAVVETAFEGLADEGRRRRAEG